MALSQPSPRVSFGSCTDERSSAATTKAPAETQVAPSGKPSGQALEVATVAMVPTAAVGVHMRMVSHDTPVKDAIVGLTSATGEASFGRDPEASSGQCASRQTGAILKPGASPNPLEPSLIPSSRPIVSTALRSAAPAAIMVVNTTGGADVAPFVKNARSDEAAVDNLEEALKHYELHESGVGQVERRNAADLRPAHVRDLDENPNVIPPEPAEPFFPWWRILVCVCPGDALSSGTTQASPLH